MEPPGATARLSTSPTVTSNTKLESVASRLDEAKYPGSTWPVGHQRSQMVAAWQGNSMRQMQEPQVGGVPRSVLQRLLGKPVENAPNTPLHSPRRRCSAASAAMVSMVHSPRTFASNPLEKRDPTAQTAPFPCVSPMFPTPEFGSYESNIHSNCSSGCSSPTPIGNFIDGPIPSDDEDENADEVTMLRQQVALLVKSLEDEKKRRASEQQLMQTKIIELQTLIRGTGEDEDTVRTRENERLENNQVRRWSAPLEEDEGVESCSCAQKPTDSSGEATTKLQLTRLRARMHAIVIDAQRETQALRAQLEGVKRSHSKREKQLTLETTIKVAALEQKHAVATSRLTQQVADSAAQVEKLQVEKQELLACIQTQQERLHQLQLALGGKHIVDASR
ncbi:hypothetical protein, variant 2 [Phytophthora nicotianae CJ01A1]|uniref:Uncharacterized protein n=6 Tax=Phytophthora nicotianae TaxID=4792 RepID=W2Q9Z0_PHYN3|nr:hypothetical protein, variant 2 [Phytophthora nicotianae INRA-310]ETI47804.1 hypothetical protein, variant 2 [Phytophthora nicotianae P1569]ETK87720.1 hypothetical protein, variant 2 [Phytophthora nicotianae]ETO76499.1 hypothetical protein, variant 2 [Phytophthora nicotianae P1976]ETP17578.1 hypothetical protein, variant 2 [Phytophthora nicotianae CJ01A1]ETP45609.1 hypothetical protein, variant 2 [Phytophthora nicotianae P10297]KUF73991.1 hypothetical protein AM587_10013455 [Phytophthora n